MSESRRNARFSALARARVNGIHEGEALLRDLSVTGCRLEFTAAVALAEGKRYRITVTPESAAEVDEFELDAESRWSRAGYDSFEIGFAIVFSPKGKSFQRYVDYLAWRALSVPTTSQ
ncbi:MAG: hypothetical protein A2Z99_09575 [Treponema sp. GWB1_62_6]|nr:MAG: hypothetical protein A2Z99_09575 [Treponema sp. GWB1_62_6]HCM27674.1 PilZ domain-containing protein [Treponema sp.]